MFKNKTYDKLKTLALVGLPALAALYFGLSQIWGLPNAEKVVGTLTVLDTFLGLVLKSSNSSYRARGAGTDGQLIVQDDGEELYPALGGNGSLKDLVAGKDEVRLQVVRQPVPPSESLKLPTEGI